MSAAALFEEQLADRPWIPSVEYNIPKPAGDSVAHFDSAGAVMVQVVSLEMPEEPKPRLSEMQEIMEPLFADIALHDTRKQGGESEHGKEEAKRGGHKKERQDILQFTADVPAVKGSLMMFPMERVEPLMKKAANEALTRREAPVEHVAMKKILDQAPHRQAHEIKDYSDPQVSGTQDEQRHDQRVRCVESRQRIEPSPRNPGLFAFVGFE